MATRLPTRTELSRSSDFGTTYTKLTLQPGVTTVIDNFYICPANKRKNHILVSLGPFVHVKLLLLCEQLQHMLGEVGSQPTLTHCLGNLSSGSGSVDNGPTLDSPVGSLGPREPFPFFGIQARRIKDIREPLKKTRSFPTPPTPHCGVQRAF
ncbi:hypothetical protein STEG23_000105 [Scotinomys teguina]